MPIVSRHVVTAHCLRRQALRQKIIGTLLYFSSGCCNSFHACISNAAANFSILDNETFQRERSTADTYVRSSSHSNASFSWDQPLFTRNKRMLYASVSLTSPIDGFFFGGVGFADIPQECRYDVFASTEYASHIELMFSLVCYIYL